MSLKEKIEAANDQLARLESNLAVGSEQVSRLRYALDLTDDEGTAIRIPITAMGKGAKFGETIVDRDRFFASTREPIGKRVVYDVAVDIWDTGFVANDVDEDKGDVDLDDKLQAALTDLNYKQVLTRSALFERRYGWGIIVLQYDDDAEKLEDPLPKDRKGLKISMLEPYPKTKILNVETVTQELVDKEMAPPERLGYPYYYYVDRGDDKSMQLVTGTKIHYSRVIHDSVRLDEHKWQGVSILDAMFDDMTVFRNTRWGMGQTMYRIGPGFPVITLKGAKEKDVQRYYSSGKFSDLCARTYLVKNENEEIEFKGASGVALNPAPYYESCIENLSMGSRIPKAVLRGAQAGTVAGSEVNLFEYVQYIGSEQSLKEKILRELIDRLIETGQIETTAQEYTISWLSIMELSEREKSLIQLNKSLTAKHETEYKTLDEIRKSLGLEELPNGQGKVILGVLKLQLQAARQMMGAQSKDARATASQFREQQLLSEFRKLRDALKRSDLTLEAALEQGEKLIDTHVKASITSSLRRLEEITGQPLNEESPEAQDLRNKERHTYMEYLKRILEDVDTAKKAG